MLAATETQLTRISFEEYNVLPEKSQTGRPTQYAVKKENVDNPAVFLYPIPDNNIGVLNNEAIRQIEDVNKSCGSKCRNQDKIFTLFFWTSLLYHIKRPGVPECR